jgi:hypothetical protein
MASVNGLKQQKGSDLLTRKNPEPLLIRDFLIVATTTSQKNG